MAREEDKNCDSVGMDMSSSSSDDENDSKTTIAKGSKKEQHESTFAPNKPAIDPHVERLRKTMMEEAARGSNDSDDSSKRGFSRKDHRKSRSREDRSGSREHSYKGRRRRRSSSRSPADDDITVDSKQSKVMDHHDHHGRRDRRRSSKSPDKHNRDSERHRRRKHHKRHYGHGRRRSRSPSPGRERRRSRSPSPGRESAEKKSAGVDTKQSTAVPTKASNIVDPFLVRSVNTPAPITSSSLDANGKPVMLSADEIQKMVAEQMRKKSEAEVEMVKEMTGVEIPKYYNTTSINPLQMAETIKKRKRLWGSTSAKKGDGEGQKEGGSIPENQVGNTSGSASSNATNCAFVQPISGSVDSSNTPSTKGSFNKWESTNLGNSTEKFRRLMGIKNGGGVVNNTGSSSSAPSTTTNKAENSESSMFAKQEEEYERARTFTHLARGKGFGFS